MFQTKFGGLADLFAALQIASLRGAIFCPIKYGFQRFHGEGFLFRTLQDVNQIDSILSLIVKHGKKNAPDLFTGKFIERTRNRIRFASLAQQKDFSLLSVPRGWIKGEKLLKSFFIIFPRRFFKLLLYIFIRPFDIIPALIYRLNCYLKRNIQWRIK